MSVTIMSAVWQLDLPASDKLVLLALADCANDEGGCWPSMATLRTKCSKGERTIQASIKSLCEAGHLTRDERPGRGCYYTVHPRKNCAPAKTAPPQKLRDTPAESADKPSRTIIVDKAKALPTARARPNDFPKPDFADPDVWRDFLTNRKRKRLANTATAHAKLLRDLTAEAARTGWPPGDVLRRCTARGWGAIYRIDETERQENAGWTPHEKRRGGSMQRAADIARQRLGIG